MERRSWRMGRRERMGRRRKRKEPMERRRRRMGRRERRKEPMERHRRRMGRRRRGMGVAEAVVERRRNQRARCKWILWELRKR